MSLCVVDHTATQNQVTSSLVNEKVLLGMVGTVQQKYEYCYLG